MKQFDCWGSHDIGKTLKGERIESYCVRGNEAGVRHRTRSDGDMEKLHLIWYSEHKSGPSNCKSSHFLLHYTKFRGRFIASPNLILQTTTNLNNFFTTLVTSANLLQ